MSVIGRGIPFARSLSRSLVTTTSRSSDALFVHREKDADAEKFEWTPENRKRAEAIIGIYPKGYECGAIMPLLDLAQRQYGMFIRLNCLLGYLNLFLFRLATIEGNELCRRLPQDSQDEDL